MNLRALVLAASSAFFSVAAFAQPCATGGPTGGVVTPEGECDGADAIFCQDNNVVRVPCAAVAAGAPAGVCEVYPGFGSWCAFDDGEPCIFQIGQQRQTFACVTDTSTCVSGVCTAGAFACTPPAPNAEQDASCLDGASLSLGCTPWGQTSVLTCAGVDPASTCAGDVCANIPNGGVCADGIAECAGGLECTGQSANAAGACDEPAAEGEGEGEDDDNGGNGRDDEPETPPGGCLNALGVVPAFAPLALVLIALRRRRRA
jgi:MYXO-CTERM domain-containing protein